ncbi:MAG: hypothetical protein COV44_00610 [Deltaproteobacteria bacterium CG11_big_fil_rev_8_21_14_0_20_45_16]|nr:MAG: hypothetical protein COV44_00610 [Deltaproteobacteria bacterium CG11_big_fil_rev_8_21_14_0_20_45_16]
MKNTEVITVVLCALATLVLGAETAFAKPINLEPIQCHKMATADKWDGGLQIGQSMATELCAGSLDSELTIECFRLAVLTPKYDGGLGLAHSEGVKLCGNRSFDRTRSD